jgi:hypothetical protein
MYLGRYMGLGGRLCMQNRSQTAAKQRSEKKQQQAGSSRIQRVYDRCAAFCQLHHACYGRTAVRLYGAADKHRQDVLLAIDSIDD